MIGDLHIEKDNAFARAKEKIDDAGITDIHLKEVLSGKNVGGQYWLGTQPFTVDDPEVIWEMIQNGVASDKIIDHVDHVLIVSAVISIAFAITPISKKMISSNE